MTPKLLAFAVSVSLLFYCVIPLVYLFPRIAESKALGASMLMMALFVVTPTWIDLVVRLCRLGLRTGGISSRSGQV
jgi:hypothetical protein